MQVTAVYITIECRSFGFETYWEREKLEHAQSGRSLGEKFSIGEWTLVDPTVSNTVGCAKYVADAISKEGGVFADQSEHASFQIFTAKGTIRLYHGRLHHLPMRDPIVQFGLPDHFTWTMDMAIDNSNSVTAPTAVLARRSSPQLTTKATS